MRRLLRSGLGWLFDRLYHELASVYDPVSWLVSGGRWRRWQQEALAYVAGMRVLEVGPGTGHLLAALRNQGYDAFAVERSSAMARRAAGRAGPGRVVQGDGRSLPFAADSFDTILATFPAPYVLDDAFAREVARVLRPGGRLVLLLGAESGVYPWPGILERLLRWTAPQPGERRDERVLSHLAGKHFFRATKDGRLSLYVAERVSGLSEH